MAKFVSADRYTEMKERYDKEVEMYKRDKDRYCTKYWEEFSKRCVLEEKCKLYEKLIAKLFNERTSPTDGLFIFENNVYRPVEFNMNISEDKCANLTVEFVKCDVDFLKKGEPA